MSKGGRGGTSGGATGGVGVGKVRETSSLISLRETYQTEVDQALEVLSDVRDRLGIDVNDMLVANVSGSTLGYYDGSGNIAINEKYFKNLESLNSVYDNSIKTGFHPERGKYSGLQAVMIHELGHRLNYVAGGSTWDNLDKSAEEMVKRATKAVGMGNRTAQFRQKISGYADRGGAAEAVAESFADVYMNGNRAKRESRALYNELITQYGLNGGRR